jgi:drug/metabolite transporter (DMT)-like permease
MGMKWSLVGIVALFNTVGDLLNSAGMKRQREVKKLTPGSLTQMVRRAVHNPLVLGGFVSLTVAFLALVSLLSIADVSFAIPATCISYVLETLFAKYLLKEDVRLRRWMAVLLVACGVVLLQW